jgi:carbon starvation protein
MGTLVILSTFLWVSEMNSAVICIFVLAGFAIAFRYYARWLAEKVFVLDDSRQCPAYEHEDGVDFVPTNKHVLIGHHFSSIAGAAPIVGPAVAVIWGWVPAVLWIAFGVVFAGAVHDMGALVISMRHGGRSIGDVTASVIGPRSRVLFLFIIFFLTMMVLAVFAFVIGVLFTSYPGAILPITVEIPVAGAVGWWVYKKSGSLLVPSVVVLLGLYGLIYVGALTADTAASAQASLFGPERSDQILGWCYLLLIYSFIASVLPVWLLLQPRDFINSHQLVVGLGALIIGLMIVHPPMNVPAFQAVAPTADGMGKHWFPLLFVTIACGAVSGFHGLVSSGTTSKQIKLESDAKVIGYGAMLGEGTLALLATLAATAGFALVAENGWEGHFQTWESANGLPAKLSAFVDGSGVFLGGLGIPAEVGTLVVAVLVISFAATSLDTATRIQRFVVQELGEIYKIKVLTNRYVAGLVAVGSALFLLLAASPKGAGSGGLILWPLFGAGNQLLAGLTLLVISIWLKQTGKNYWVTLIPAVFLGLVTCVAMAINVQGFVDTENWMLLSISGIIIVLELWIVFEGIAAFRQKKPSSGVI